MSAQPTNSDTFILDNKVHYFFMAHGGCWCGERHFTEEEAAAFGPEMSYQHGETALEQMWQLKGAWREFVQEVRQSIRGPRWLSWLRQGILRLFRLR